MKFSRKMLLIPAVLVATVLLGACDDTPASKAEQARNDKSKNVIACGLNGPAKGESLECVNLRERERRNSDPAKISYVYLVGFDGNVKAYLTVKGKVSSTQSQMGPMDLILDCDDGTGCSDTVVEAPGDDGSYGPNEDGIFFFTTEGVMVNWNGQFILSDAPLAIDAPSWNSKK